MTGLSDWERSVWNEMQADAAPSKEEAEQMQRKAEALHAELKATLALIEAKGEPNHIDVAYAVADHLGFDRLLSEIRPYVDRNHAGRKRYSDLVKRHLEPHEIPDPDEFERQVPPVAYQHGFRITDRVRRLKAEAWLQLPQPDHIRIEREKRSAGGAVRYDVTVSGNPNLGDY